MMKPILKISLIVFLFLSLIISLFLPFEFGGEKLRTLSERKVNRKIAEKLPVKTYDFIFNSNKKYFVLDHHSFPRKFYNNDSLKFYKAKWRDKKFVLENSSVDSFFSANRFLYLGRYKFKFGTWGYITPPNKIFGIENAYAPTGPKTLYYYKDGNKVVKYYFPERNKDAKNYDQVKNEYIQNPNNWDFKYILNLDSTKKYEQFSIVEPVYYLLNRKILIGEISIEYILALIISFIVGYFYQFVRKQ